MKHQQRIPPGRASIFYSLTIVLLLGMLTIPLTRHRLRVEGTENPPLSTLKDAPLSAFVRLGAEIEGMGRWLSHQTQQLASSYLLWALGGMAVLALLLIGGNYLLHRQIRQRALQLKASESRLRSLVQRAADAILLFDREGHILEINPAATVILGYSQDELLQMSIENIDPDCVAEDGLTKLWEQLQAGEVVTVVSSALRKDASTFPVESRVSLVQHGGQTVMLGVTRDISRRVQAQQALQRRTQELEILRQASLSLTSELALTPVLDALLEYALRLIPADDAHIFLYDGEKLEFGAARWRDGRTGVPFAMPRRDGVTYTVAQSGERTVVSVMSTSPLFQSWSQAGSLEGAIAGLPLCYQGRVIGVMNIAFMQPYEFSATELNLLELLADQAAVAIANAQLYEQIQQHAHDLDQRVAERTSELQRFINVMAGREIRMAELKQVVRALRRHLLDAGLQPVADDPLGAANVEVPDGSDGHEI